MKNYRKESVYLTIISVLVITLICSIINNCSQTYEKSFRCYSQIDHIFDFNITGTKVKWSENFKTSIVFYKDRILGSFTDYKCEEIK